MRRPRLALTLLALCTAALTPAAAHAQAPGGGSGPCLTADPPPITAPAHGLRFGITPGAAGSVGSGQSSVAPIDEAKETAALRRPAPAGRELVLRLNRLFWADGDAGIDRFARLVDRYAAAGLRSEIQVRYHPPEGAEGDIDAWEDFVRKAVRRLGRPPGGGRLLDHQRGELPGLAEHLRRFVRRRDRRARPGHRGRPRGARRARPTRLSVGFNVAVALHAGRGREVLGPDRRQATPASGAGWTTSGSRSTPASSGRRPCGPA